MHHHWRVSLLSLSTASSHAGRSRVVYPYSYIQSSASYYSRSSIMQCTARHLGRSRFQNTAQHPIVFNHQCVAMSSKSSEEDTVEAEEGLGEVEFGSEMLGVGNEDELDQQFVTNLYPDNPDPILAAILSSSSIEQVFEAYDSASSEGEPTPEQSAQALVSLYDLQKLIFQIGSPLYDTGRELSMKQDYAQQITQHPTFQRIMHHLLANVRSLEDEAIASSLLTLKKLEFRIRSPESQALIQECLIRKSTIELSALSRLCVVLRQYPIYGHLILTEFFPRLSQLIKEMDAEGVRLVSIALRSANRSIPPSLLEIYQDRIRSLLDSQELLNCDSGLYAKIMVCLADTRFVQREFAGRRSTNQQLQREVGLLLAPNVADLNLLSLLSLQRVMESGSLEPPALMDALSKRVSRLIEEQEETPRLDLLSLVSPTLVRSIEQRKRLSFFIHKYLDGDPKFHQIYRSLIKILKAVKLNDEELYKKFWDKATQWIRLESSEPRKVIELTLDYLSFNSTRYYSFRHINFESQAKQLLYFYLANYQRQEQPTLIAPSDFTRLYAFLIAFSWHAEPIFQESSHHLLAVFEEQFAKQSRAADLLLLVRGISTSLNYQGKNPRSPQKYFDQILNFTSAVEKLVCQKLDDTELSTTDLAILARVQALIKKTTDSYNFEKAVALIGRKAESEYFNSLDGKNIALLLAKANHHDPTVLKFLQNFIRSNPEAISVEFTEKFLHYAYTLGLEPQTPEESKVFQTCYSVIEKYWETIEPSFLIQSCLALSFAQSLHPPLAHNMFSVDFLKKIEDEIKFSSMRGNCALRIRKGYMELNRAVCLDLPSANIPWFHQKYCEAVFSNHSAPETSMEKEVRDSLTEVLNDNTGIQQDVYTPYFYHLNFLLEFDKAGKPIKKRKSNRLLSLRLNNLRPGTENVEVGERVGIIVQPVGAYTSNLHTLKGYCLMRKRHLEMLGYRVIHVDPYHWNSMYMSEPSAKTDYLESVIFDKPPNTGTRRLPQVELNLV